jgi:hypothetical protein
LASHRNSTEAIFFSPNEGRLAEASPDNIRLLANSGNMFEIESLQDSGNVQADTSDENIHPLTGSAEHYALYDWFHEGNCKKPEEVLRRVSLLSNFAGFIESQIVEQLFSSLKNMLKFLNKTTPINHMFHSRLLL